MKYLLTLQVEFEADDDPAARKQAVKILNDNTLLSAKNDLKLRCIYENKQPRTIDFKYQGIQGIQGINN